LIFDLIWILTPRGCLPALRLDLAIKYSALLTSGF
jgi:hypothetical protein